MVLALIVLVRHRSALRRCANRDRWNGHGCVFILTRLTAPPRTGRLATALELLDDCLWNRAAAASLGMCDVPFHALIQRCALGHWMLYVPGRIDRCHRLSSAWECEVQVVRMLSVCDCDRHRACDSFKLLSA